MLVGEVFDLFKDFNDESSKVKAVAATSSSPPPLPPPPPPPFLTSISNPRKTSSSSFPFPQIFPERFREEDGASEVGNRQKQQSMLCEETSKKRDDEEKEEEEGLRYRHQFPSLGLEEEDGNQDKFLTEFEKSHQFLYLNEHQHHCRSRESIGESESSSDDSCISKKSREKIFLRSHQSLEKKIVKHASSLTGQRDEAKEGTRRISFSSSSSSSSSQKKSHLLSSSALSPSSHKTSSTLNEFSGGVLGKMAAFYWAKIPHDPEMYSWGCHAVTQRKELVYTFDTNKKTLVEYDPTWNAWRLLMTFRKISSTLEYASGGAQLAALSDALYFVTHNWRANALRVSRVLVPPPSVSGASSSQTPCKWTQIPSHASHSQCPPYLPCLRRYHTVVGLDDPPSLWVYGGFGGAHRRRISSSILPLSSSLSSSKFLDSSSSSSLPVTVAPSASSSSSISRSESFSSSSSTSLESDDVYCWEEEILDDLWTFHLSSCRWRRIVSQTTEEEVMVPMEIHQTTSFPLPSTSSEASVGKQKLRKRKNRNEENRKRVLPEGRAGHSVVSWKGGMYIFGGCSGFIFGGGQSQQTMLNDLWRFDFKFENWKAIQVTGTLPSPRHRHVAGLVEEQMIIFGGETIDKNFPLTDLHIINLHLKVSTRIDISSPSPPPLIYRGVVIPSFRSLFLFGAEIHRLTPAYSNSTALRRRSVTTTPSSSFAHCVLRSNGCGDSSSSDIKNRRRRGNSVRTFSDIPADFNNKNQKREISSSSSSSRGAFIKRIYGSTIFHPFLNSTFFQYQKTLTSFQCCCCYGELSSPSLCFEASKEKKKKNVDVNIELIPNSSSSHNDDDDDRLVLCDDHHPTFTSTQSRNVHRKNCSENEMDREYGNNSSSSFVLSSPPSENIRRRTAKNVLTSSSSSLLPSDLLLPPPPPPPHYTKAAVEGNAFVSSPSSVVSTCSVRSRSTNSTMTTSSRSTTHRSSDSSDSKGSGDSSNSIPDDVFTKSSGSTNSDGQNNKKINRSSSSSSTNNKRQNSSKSSMPHLIQMEVPSIPKLSIASSSSFSLSDDLFSPGIEWTVRTDTREKLS